MPVEFVKQPAGLGEPRGEFSHLSIASGSEIVAVAGQTGITVSGALAGDGSVGAQVRQAFRNVATALQSAGLGMADVFKTTTYLVGGDGIDKFIAARTDVFRELFPGSNYPPNTLVVVSRLMDERLCVEIEALAVRAAWPGRAATT